MKSVLSGNKDLVPSLYTQSRLADTQYSACNHHNTSMSMASYRQILEKSITGRGAEASFDITPREEISEFEKTVEDSHNNNIQDV